MYKQFKSLSLNQRLVLLIIPTIALLVVIRQHYLSQTQNLSIWKGGGMGMFAASDTVSRIVKIYIETPQGDKHPIIDLNPSLKILRYQVKFNPSKRNFRQLAEALARTQLIGGNEKFPHRVLDEFGNEITRKEGTYYYLRPAGPRPKGDTPNWKVIIEYWNMRFDTETKIARPHLIERFSQGVW